MRGRIFIPNEVVKLPDSKLGILLQNIKGEYVDTVIINIEDYEKVKNFRWYKRIDGYAGTNRKNVDDVKIFMHQIICPEEDNLYVDHIDRNRLNNARSNLRRFTARGNLLNRTLKKSDSAYRGVTWHKRDKVWQANIVVFGKIKYLGCSKDEEEAAKKYDTAALRAHGEEVAMLNFPENIELYRSLIGDDKN